MIRLVLGSILIVGCLLLGFALILVWQFVGGWDLYPGTVLRSPSGRYVSQFYGLGGGGAAGWYFNYLQITEADRAFEPRTNVVFVTSNGDLCVRWVTDTELYVEYPSDVAVIDEDKRTQLIIGKAVVRIAYAARRSKEGQFVDPGCDGALMHTDRVDSSWSIIE